MALTKTNWQIIVQAQTGQAERGLIRLATAAGTAQKSFNQLQASTLGVTQEVRSVARPYDLLAQQIKKGKLSMEQYQNVMRNNKNIVRRQNQLMGAQVSMWQATDGAITSTQLTMRKFRDVGATFAQRMALANTATRALATSVVDMGKNMQWAGRQITVGFTVPFGIAMLGASAAFLKFEEQVVRFRKVFNDELGTGTAEAERAVVDLATNMARDLGVVRNEVIETAATFAQMGMASEDVNRLTEATTRLALLGEVPRETATQLIRAYDASGFDEMAGGIENVINHLNALENNTSLTVQMMAQSLPQIIPIFEQVNLSFGEGEALVAGMVQSLGNSSEAVNALKVGLQRVYDPTQEAKDAFEEIGVSLDDLRNKYGDDVIGYFQELGTIMETGISNNAEFAETIGNLFGVRQAGRLATGLRAVNDETSDFARGMAVAGKSAEELAQTSESEITAMTESIGGRLKRLKEGIIADITEIGGTFLEMAMPFFEYVAEMISKFNNWDESTQKLVLRLGALAAGLGGLIMIAGIAINLFGMTFKLFSNFLPTLSLITGETVGLNATFQAFNGTAGRSILINEKLQASHLESAVAAQAHAGAVMNLGNQIAITNGIGLRSTAGVGVGMASRTQGASLLAAGGGAAGGVGRAAVNWRKSTMGAGALMMGASMIPGMKGGDFLQGAGGAAMVASMIPKWTTVTGIVTKFTTMIRTMPALIAKMATAIGPVGAAVAALGAGVFYLWKQWRENNKAIEEFKDGLAAVDEAIASTGMSTLGEFDPTTGVIESDNNLSQGAQAVYDLMQKNVDASVELGDAAISWRDAAGDFVSRALAAGNSIEEVNGILEEIEEFTGEDLVVTVDGNVDPLKSAIDAAITNAINRLQLLNSEMGNAWWKPGDEFDDRAEATATQAINILQADSQSFWARSGEIFATAYAEGEAVNSRDAEILQEMGRQLGVDEQAASEIRTQSDLLREIAASIGDIRGLTASQKEQYDRMLQQLSLADLRETEGERKTAVEITARRVMAEMAPSDRGQYTDYRGVISDEALMEFAREVTENSEMAMRSGSTNRNLSRDIDTLRTVVDQFDRTVQARENRIGVKSNEYTPGRNEVEEALRDLQETTEDGTEAEEENTEETEKNTQAIDSARSAVAGIIGQLRGEISGQQGELTGLVMESYDEETEKIIENIEKERDAEVEAMEDRVDAIDEWLDKRKAMQDALSKQLDLIFAIAGGEVDRAAQLQNEMMFQEITGFGDDEKAEIDKEVEKINEKYDKQIEREQQLREEQRKTLDDYLTDLNRVTVASQAEWNSMYDAIIAKATQAGVDITDSIRDKGRTGFADAVDNWVVAVTDDERWDRLSTALAHQMASIGQDLGTVAFNIGKALSGKVDVDALVELGKKLGLEDLELDGSGSSGGGGGGGGGGGDSDGGSSPAPADTSIDLSRYSYNPGGAQGPTGTRPTRDPEAGAGFIPDGTIMTPGGWLHTGGSVGGGPPKDVPIIAQTGEYMIQRKAAQVLGPDMLSQLNNAHKYHDGGMISPMMTTIANKGAMAGAVTGLSENIAKEMKKRAAERARAQAAAGMRGTDYYPIIGTGAGPTERLLPPDVDWTRWSSKYYGGWTYGLQPGIAKKAATHLAQLPGAQGIVNAYRDPEHNRRVGGASNSYHKQGKAIDFVNASGATSISWLNRMGSWFQGKPGVGWIGMPKTDSGGGHNDHVHVSYKHSGGPIGMFKGGKVMHDNTPTNLHRGELVLRRPLAQSLETGIEKLNNGETGGGGNTFVFEIENFGGTRADANAFAGAVKEVLDKEYRSKNPTRRIR